jgi:hypothetical protein
VRLNSRGFVDSGCAVRPTINAFCTAIRSGDVPTAVSLRKRVFERRIREQCSLHATQAMDQTPRAPMRSRGARTPAAVVDLEQKSNYRAGG